MTTHAWFSALVGKYDPTQPRDAGGRWTDGDAMPARVSASVRPEAAAVLRVAGVQAEDFARRMVAGMPDEYTYEVTVGKVAKRYSGNGDPTDVLRVQIDGTGKGGRAVLAATYEFELGDGPAQPGRLFLDSIGVQTMQRGAGAQLVANALDAARTPGLNINRAEMGAAQDGAYAWPRMGFTHADNWPDRDPWRREMVQRHMAAMQKAGDLTKAQVAEVWRALDDPDPKAIWRIADMKPRAAAHRLLADNGFHRYAGIGAGNLVLRFDDAAAMQRLGGYVATRRAAVRKGEDDAGPMLDLNAWAFLHVCDVDRDALAKYDPAQPRVPAGTPTAGQWVRLSGGLHVGSLRGQRAFSGVHAGSPVLLGAEHIKHVRAAVQEVVGDGPSGEHEAAKWQQDVRDPATREAARAFLRNAGKHPVVSQELAVLASETPWNGVDAELPKGAIVIIPMGASEETQHLVGDTLASLPVEHRALLASTREYGSLGTVKVLPQVSLTSLDAQSSEPGCAAYFMTGAEMCIGERSVERYRKTVATMNDVAEPDSADLMRSVVLHETGHAIDFGLAGRVGRSGTSFGSEKIATLKRASDDDVSGWGDTDASRWVNTFTAPLVKPSELFADAYAYLMGARYVRGVASTEFARAFPRAIRVTRALLHSNKLPTTLHKAADDGLTLCTIRVRAPLGKDADFEAKHPRDKGGRFSGKEAIDAFVAEFEARSFDHPVDWRIRVTNFRLTGGGERHYTAMVKLYPLGDEGVHLEELVAVTRGGGRKAMEMLTELADKHGVILDLFASPIPGVIGQHRPRTQAELMAFYREFGFEGYREPGARRLRDPLSPTMVRYPAGMTPFAKAAPGVVDANGMLHAAAGDPAGGQFMSDEDRPVFVTDEGAVMQLKTVREKAERALRAVRAGALRPDTSALYESEAEAAAIAAIASDDYNPVTTARKFEAALLASVQYRDRLKGWAQRRDRTDDELAAYPQHPNAAEPAIVEDQDGSGWWHVYASQEDADRAKAAYANGQSVDEPALSIHPDSNGYSVIAASGAAPYVMRSELPAAWFPTLEGATAEARTIMRRLAWHETATRNLGDAYWIAETLQNGIDPVVEDGPGLRVFGETSDGPRVLYGHFSPEHIAFGYADRAMMQAHLVEDDHQKEESRRAWSAAESSEGANDPAITAAAARVVRLVHPSLTGGDADVIEEAHGDNGTLGTLRGSIKRYQRSSSPINDSARGIRTRDFALQDRQAEIGKADFDLMAALVPHFPLQGAREMFRGVRGALAGDLAVLKSGDAFTDKGFASFTTHHTNAFSFAGRGGTIIRTIWPDGWPAIPALRSDEQEYILPPGTEFTVKHVEHFRTVTQSPMTLVTVVPRLQKAYKPKATVAKQENPNLPAPSPDDRWVWLPGDITITRRTSRATVGKATLDTLPPLSEAGARRLAAWTESYRRQLQALDPMALARVFRDQRGDDRLSQVGIGALTAWERGDRGIAPFTQEQIDRMAGVYRRRADEYLRGVEAMKEWRERDLATLRAGWDAFIAATGTDTTRITKRWKTMGDHKVRDQHREVDGVTLTYDESFIVDGESVWGPPQSYGCRCTLVITPAPGALPPEWEVSPEAADQMLADAADALVANFPARLGSVGPDERPFPVVETGPPEGDPKGSAWWEPLFGDNKNEAVRAAREWFKTLLERIADRKRAPDPLARDLDPLPEPDTAEPEAFVEPDVDPERTVRRRPGLARTTPKKGKKKGPPASPDDMRKAILTVIEKYRADQPRDERGRWSDALGVIDSRPDWNRYAGLADASGPDGLLIRPTAMSADLDATARANAKRVRTIFNTLPVSARRRIAASLTEGVSVAASMEEAAAGTAIGHVPSERFAAAAGLHYSVDDGDGPVRGVLFSTIKMAAMVHVVDDGITARRHTKVIALTDEQKADAVFHEIVLHEFGHALDYAIGGSAPLSHWGWDKASVRGSLARDKKKIERTLAIAPNAFDEDNIVYALSSPKEAFAHAASYLFGAQQVAGMAPTRFASYAPRTIAAVRRALARAGVATVRHNVVKFEADQPRIPKGQKGGGRWARTGSTMTAFEMGIAEDEIETAALTGGVGANFEKTGNHNSVEFTDDELRAMAGGTLTHNHPNASSFSTDDMAIFTRTRMAELRAVGTSWDGQRVLYRLQRPKDWDATTAIDKFVRDHAAHYEKESANDTPIRRSEARHDTRFLREQIEGTLRPRWMQAGDTDRTPDERAAIAMAMIADHFFDRHHVTFNNRWATRVNGGMSNEEANVRTINEHSHVAMRHFARVMGLRYARVVSAGRKRTVSALGKSWQDRPADSISRGGRVLYDEWPTYAMPTPTDGVQKFDADQPRAPKGEPNGGQWVKGSAPSLGDGRSYEDHARELEASGLGEAAANLRRFMDGSKVTEAVLHGTTRDFEEFGYAYANPDNFFGAGHYFTDDLGDAGAHYASADGPDLRNNLELWIEANIDRDDDGADLPREEKLRIARESLGVTHGGATVPVFLAMKKPALLYAKGSELSFRYGEPTTLDRRGVRLFARALRDVGAEYGMRDGEVADMQQRFFEHVAMRREEWGEGKIDLGEALTAATTRYAFMDSQIDVEGAGDPRLRGRTDTFPNMYKQFQRDLVRRLKFDGIIMDPGVFNGMQHKFQRGDAAHYIVWSSRQVKSAVGNRGTYDRRDPNITKAAPGVVDANGMLHAAAGDPTGGQFISPDDMPVRVAGHSLSRIATIQRHTSNYNHDGRRPEFAVLKPTKEEAEALLGMATEVPGQNEFVATAASVGRALAASLTWSARVEAVAAGPQAPEEIEAYPQHTGEDAPEFVVGPDGRSAFVFSSPAEAKRARTAIASGVIKDTFQLVQGVWMPADESVLRGTLVISPAGSKGFVIDPISAYINQFVPVDTSQPSQRKFYGSMEEAKAAAEAVVRRHEFSRSAANMLSEQRRMVAEVNRGIDPDENGVGIMVHQTTDGPKGARVQFVPEHEAFGYWSRGMMEAVSVEDSDHETRSEAAWSAAGVATSGAVTERMKRVAELSGLPGYEDDADEALRMSGGPLAFLRGSISRYQRSSSPINDSARGIRTRQWSLDDATEQRGKADFDLMEEMIRHFPHAGDTEMYRGVRGELAGDLARLKPGDAFTDKGFASFSTHPANATSFAGAGGTIIRTIWPDGWPAIPAIRSHEQEYILPPATEFVVKHRQFYRTMAGNPMAIITVVPKLAPHYTPKATIGKAASVAHAPSSEDRWLWLPGDITITRKARVQKFDADQPRAPKGEPNGGQWVKTALSFSTEVTDAYSGQVNYNVVARDASGRAVGVVQAVSYNGEDSVSMIAVHPDARRQGVGRALIRAFLDQREGDRVRWGGATGEGAALLDATVPHWRRNSTVMAGDPEPLPGGGWDTPEWRKWFGGSVVTNADGTPRQMYHGTRHQFSNFRGDPPDQTKDIGNGHVIHTGTTIDRALGPHFTGEPATAAQFAAGIYAREDDQWGADRLLREGLAVHGRDFVQDENAARMAAAGETVPSWMRDATPFAAKPGGRVVPVYLAIRNPRVVPQPHFRDLYDDDENISSGRVGDEEAVAADAYTQALTASPKLLYEWMTEIGQENGYDYKGREWRDNARKLHEKMTARDGFEWPNQHNSGTTTYRSLQHFILRNHSDRLVLHRGDPAKQGLAFRVMRRYRQWLKDSGHDGLRYTNTSPNEAVQGGDNYVFIPLSPNQIKSAFNPRPTRSNKFHKSADFEAEHPRDNIGRFRDKNQGEMFPDIAEASEAFYREHPAAGWRPWPADPDNGDDGWGDDIEAAADEAATPEQFDEVLRHFGAERQDLSAYGHAHAATFTRTHRGEEETAVITWEPGVTGGGYSRVESVREFVDDLNVDDEVTRLNEEVHADFWAEHGPSVLYHGTDPDNHEAILSEGLLASNERRGLANRHIGNAVFAHPSEDIPRGYANDSDEGLLVIDVAKMRRDRKQGVLGTFRVEREPTPLEIEVRSRIAWDLGLEQYDADYDGQDPETLILYTDILPKYLRRYVESSDD